MNKLLSELRRRNIFRVAGVYAVVGWILMQLAGTLENSLNLPDWFDSAITAALLIGFPIAMLLTWAFEMTPQGVRRTETVSESESETAKTGRTLDYVIIGGLLIVGALVIWQGMRNQSLQARPGDVIPQDEAVENVNTQAHPEGSPQAIVSKDANPPQAASIAVLAFADMSPEGDQEYFSDGMAEEILNALVKVPGLRVAGRTSSFSFKGRNEDLIVIGRTLQVAHILEGSVRKQGEQVRITAQLIKADDGFHLWSETYDGTLDNIFELQEKIARAIAGELQVLLNVGEDIRLAEMRTRNKQAYDLYLQGRALSRQNFGEGVLARAATLLEEAVTLDPQFADAWAELALANYLTPTFTTVQDQSAFTAKAQKNVRKALAIDPLNMTAQLVLQGLRKREKKFTEARAGIDRLIAMNGLNADVAFIDGYSRASMGQTKAAIPYLEKAVSLDPTGGNVRFSLGMALLNAGDLDGAKNHLQRSFDLGYLGAPSGLATIAFLRGDSETAMELLLSLYDTIGQYYATQFHEKSLWEMVARGFYSGKEADRSKLFAIFNAYVQSPDAIVDWAILSGYLRIGEAKAFMDAFDAHPVSNSDFVFLNLWDAQETSRKVRQHPDFPGFAKRNGLLEYWQTYGWPDKCRPVEGGNPDDFTCD